MFGRRGETLYDDRWPAPPRIEERVVFAGRGVMGWSEGSSREREY